MLAVGLGAGLLAGGCVEQESSLLLRGVVQVPGSIEERSVSCGEGGGSEDMQDDGENGGDGGDQQESSGSGELVLPNYTCQETEGGNAAAFWGGVTINLADYEEGNGQRGVENEHFSNEELCAMNETHSGEQSFASTYRNSNFRHQSFVMTLDSENQLEDSREVGAEGQGGGQSGGFSGIRLDMNTIETSVLKIRFPEISGTGPGGIGADRDLDMSFVIESAGGAQIIEFAAFQRGDFVGSDDQMSTMRQLHRQAVLEETSLGSYEGDAREYSVTVKAKVWFEGKTLGGRSVESNRLTVPITLCGSGCTTTQQCNFQYEN